MARSALKTEGLTKKTKQRLKILDWRHQHGHNLSLTARRFPVPIRRWRYIEMSLDLQYNTIIVVCFIYLVSNF